MGGHGPSATGDAVSDRMFALVFVRDVDEALVRHAYRALSAHVRVDLTMEPAPRTATHGWTDNPHSMEEAPRVGAAPHTTGLNPITADTVVSVILRRPRRRG